MPYILALDQGTSSSRSIVFGHDGAILGQAQRELPQIFPRPGWVEHDPRQIWQTQLETAREALARAGLKAADLATIGITNQRETTVVWRRDTGEPVHNAIVWQDRRTEPECARLRAAGLEAEVRRRTGLVIDPYFSGPKLRWILDNVAGARQAAQRGELLFGTIDAWLVWNLTGGAGAGTRAQAVHATDVSNASRTLLYNVQESRWDAELLRAMDIGPVQLPQVHPSSHRYGLCDPALLGAAVPIDGVAGDQQSALFGQAGFEPGMAKNTYGTGCFLLMHTGEHFRQSANGLVTTRAAQCPGPAQFALEGSVFIGGAVVQWLRDGLRAITASGDVQALAASVPDAGGVVFVPAFTGLGAPYWKPEARGAIVGLTRGSTVAHIARAALESIAFQSAALLQAMSRDAVAAGAAPVAELRVDGGASVNDLLMQFQADLLGIPVVRPKITETTALGAAYLAGLSCGVYRGLAELAAQWQAQRRFLPTLSREQAEARLRQWEHAVAQATLAG